jgi:hypothetical protein
MSMSAHAWLGKNSVGCTFSGSHGRRSHDSTGPRSAVRAQILPQNLGAMGGMFMQGLHPHYMMAPQGASPITPPQIGDSIIHPAFNVPR